MIRGMESLCCKEVQRTSTKAKESNCECIREVNGFAPVFRNPDVVETAIYQFLPRADFELYAKSMYNQWKKRVTKEKIEL